MGGPTERGIRELRHARIGQQLDTEPHESEKLPTVGRMSVLSGDLDGHPSVA